MKQIVCLLTTALLFLCAALSLAEASQKEATVSDAAGGVRKVCYLTFDDGPQPDTPELLELLDELHVPATFFYVGAKVKERPELARMVYEKGYPIGCHTMYHGLKNSRTDPNVLLKDTEKFEVLMKETLGDDYKLELYRFPGGSGSYNWKVRRAIRDAGYSWIDWNCMTGDAEYNFRHDSDMYNYTVKTIGDKTTIVLLMHEYHSRTKAILPALVEHLRGQGFEFRVLSTSAEDQKILNGSNVKHAFASGEDN